MIPAKQGNIQDIKPQGVSQLLYLDISTSIIKKVDRA